MKTIMYNIDASYLDQRNGPHHVSAWNVMHCMTRPSFHLTRENHTILIWENTFSFHADMRLQEITKKDQQEIQKKWTWPTS